MQNRTLAAIRGGIPYVPLLRRYAGSIAASLLMQQLDYWFSRYPEGFYKFQSPCQHARYRHGDSWQEELGLSPDEYRTAFKHIGTAYGSEETFRAAAEPFQGKVYASFIDRKTGLTHYQRDHARADALLGWLFRADNPTPEAVAAYMEVWRPDAPECLPPLAAVEPAPKGPVDAAYKQCVELWDAHLLKHAGYGVAHAWGAAQAERSREGKALKDILNKLQAALIERQKAGGNVIEGDPGAALVHSFRALLGTWDRWQEFHKSFKLSHINSNFADIVYRIKNERNGANTPAKSTRAGAPAIDGQRLGEKFASRFGAG